MKSKPDEDAIRVLRERLRVNSNGIQAIRPRVQTILKGTGLVSTIWAALRTQRSHRDDTSGQDSRS